MKPAQRACTMGQGMIVLHEFRQMDPLAAQGLPIPAFAEEAAFIGKTPRNQDQQSLYRRFFNHQGTFLLKVMPACSSPSKQTENSPLGWHIVHANTGRPVERNEINFSNGKYFQPSTAEYHALIGAKTRPFGRRRRPYLPR